MQSFTAPVSGTYQLEVWGGQGQNGPTGEKVTGQGGLGGYATGRKYLSAGTTLYVCVGGGSGNTYNGGGTNYRTYGKGGGATHIATVNRGTLVNYASTYKSEVLLVAGGGGGGGKDDDNYTSWPNGGTGGGYTGGATISWSYNLSGQGGTQTAGGDGYPNGSFGKGGDIAEWVHDPYEGGKGGGGLYGGGGSNWDNASAGGGGGSGYLGAVSNGSMQNGVRSGNGYAKITLVSAG